MEAVGPEEDPAAAAFDQLREEVAQLRDQVALLLNRSAPDYAPTLGALAKSLADIENLPGLHRSPEELISRFKAETEVARREGQREFEPAVQRLDSATVELHHLLGRVRAGQRLVWWTGTAASLGLLGGCLLWIFVSGPIARGLPHTWKVPERLAAATLDRDPWDAGMQLLRSASPEQAARLSMISSARLADKSGLEACRQALVHADVGRRCVIMFEENNDN
jgi:hypothetical protein